MDQKFITTYEYLEKNHPMAAQDIYYGLELFTNSLDYGIEAFQKEIAEKIARGISQGCRRLPSMLRRLRT